MRKTLCILSWLALGICASAAVEVRFWVTTEPPDSPAGGNMTFWTGYGPFTAYGTGGNFYGAYDIHRNYVSVSNPGSVATPKFTVADIPDVVEPRDLPPGTPVYLWAAFCGPGDVAPIKPLLGWEYGHTTAVQALHLRLVTTGTLTVSPTWYQYETWDGSPPERTGGRWAEDSDMSGGDALMVSIFDLGWGWGCSDQAERMQTAVSDEGYGGEGMYYAGGILLGAIEQVSGSGELFIGLGYKGIYSPNGSVEFFPGTELDGIPAGTYGRYSPPRTGQTPEATWVDLGETCSSAFPISSLPYTDVGTTAGRANNYDPGVMTGCPNGGSTAPDVVYEYTPASDVRVDISLCNSVYDTKLYVYEDACTGSAVACDDDYTGCGNGYQSRLVGETLLASHTYYIVVDGAANESGAYQIAVEGSRPIVAWGYNGYAQCNVPAPNTDFVAVAAGWRHSLGLKADGSIVAWGDNTYAQCNVPSPNASFIAVAAGSTHSLGLKSEGSIVAWGRNNSGQCNVPSPNTSFVAVAGGGNWSNSFSLGLKANGSIVAWGANGAGQCNVPAPNTGFTAVAAGGYHGLGLKSYGSIVGWGSNGSGQRNAPSPNTNFVAVAADADHSLGLKDDGSVVGWGTNYSGESTPPAPNTDFVAIAAGVYHSLGLKADGSIVVWGLDAYGLHNVPSPNAGFVGIAAKGWHCLGLKAPGAP
jgi:hypothetical protein